MAGWRASRRPLRLITLCLWSVRYLHISASAATCVVCVLRAVNTRKAGRWRQRLSARGLRRGIGDTRTSSNAIERRWRQVV